MVSKRLRFEILRRDGFRCRYCGRSADAIDLTVDHVVPTALGGGDHPSNLAAACRDCNAGKAASSPDQPIVEDVAHDAIRWRKAMEQAAAFQRMGHEERDDYCYAFLDSWNAWQCASKELPLPSDWSSTLGRFHDLGLESAHVEDAIRIAMESKVHPQKTFRYFCGVCWRKLEDRQRIAHDLLESEEG